MQCAILNWSNVASRVPTWSSDLQTSPQVSTDTLQVVSLVSVGLHLIINQVSPVLPLQGPGRVKWHLKYDPNPPHLSFQESLRDLSMIDFLIMLMHWHHEQGYRDLPLIREGIMGLFRKVAFPDETPMRWLARRWRRILWNVLGVDRVNCTIVVNCTTGSPLLSTSTDSCITAQLTISSTSCCKNVRTMDLLDRCINTTP